MAFNLACNVCEVVFGALRLTKICSQARMSTDTCGSEGLLPRKVGVWYCELLIPPPAKRGCFSLEWYLHIRLAQL